MDNTPQAYSENPEKLPEHQCRSCSHEYEGTYCPNCGQKFIANRFTLKQSFHWIFDQILNLEKGLWYTTKILLLNPEKGIKDFLGGATVRYMHPFRYVFVLATISALMTVLFTIDGVEELQNFDFMQEDSDITKKQSENAKMFQDIFKKYLALFIMLAIPFNAIASALIYRKRKLYYTEHLILNSYAYGFTLILSIPFYLLLFLPNGFIWNAIAGTLIYFLGLAWVFSRVFKEHFIESVLKVVLLSIIAFFILLILGGLITAVLVFAYVKLIK